MNSHLSDPQASLLFLDPTLLLERPKRRQRRLKREEDAENRGLNFKALGFDESWLSCLQRKPKSSPRDHLRGIPLR